MRSLAFRRVDFHEVHSAEGAAHDLCAGAPANKCYVNAHDMIRLG